MFLEGQIVYFSPFYFKNGNTSKNKYLIVLRNLNNQIIVASLPTRTNKVPGFLSQSHGCINEDARCFNCYLFEAGKSICGNGFAFDKHSFIYGNEVEDYDVAILKSVYGIEGVDFEIVGNLIKSEYDGLMKCLVNSASVRRKIKKLLSV